MKNKVLTLLAASFTFIAAPAALADTGAEIHDTSPVTEDNAFGGYTQTCQIGCDPWGPIFRTTIYNHCGFVVRSWVHR